MIPEDPVERVAATFVLVAAAVAALLVLSAGGCARPTLGPEIGATPIGRVEAQKVALEGKLCSGGPHGAPGNNPPCAPGLVCVRDSGWRCKRGTVPPTPTRTPTGTRSPRPTGAPDPTRDPTPRPTVDTAGVSAFEITPRDVTLRLGTSSTFKYLRGRTASQADRDAMQHAALLYMQQAARYASGIRACASAVKFARSQVNLVTARLGGSDYEGKNCRTYRDRGYKNCAWRVQPQGRHYQAAHLAGRRLRDCLATSAGREPCAAAMPAELLDFLDLRIVDGQCVKGAAFTLPPTERYDKRRGEAGVLSTRTVVPALTPDDVGLLHDTHREHMAVTAYHCAGGPKPAPGAVGRAHTAYEHACGDDPVCRHFRQMKRFEGFMDPRWSAADACTLRAMQDHFHQVWMHHQERPEEAQRNPYTRWIDARLDGDNNHLLAHLCANHKDERPGCAEARGTSSGCFVVRPVCADKINRCPVMSCQAWIARWRAGER